MLRVGLLSEVITYAHLFVVIDENKIGNVLSASRAPWGDGGDAAGVNDSVGMSRHGGQAVRILILSSLILYPPLNAPRALRAGSGQLFPSSDGYRHARARKQRGLVDGGRF